MSPSKAAPREGAAGTAEHRQLYPAAGRHGAAGVLPAGARDGGGHYVLHIVSAQFIGHNTVARHRMIYSTLGKLMKREIHALTIQAHTPDET